LRVKHIAGSELVRYHDLRRRKADAEGINTTIIGALRHCLHFGHAQASLSMTLNLGDFIVQSGISAIKARKLVFPALDLHAVHLTKAVFRGVPLIYYKSLIQTKEPAVGGFFCYLIFLKVT